VIQGGSTIWRVRLRAAIVVLVLLWQPEPGIAEAMRAGRGGPPGFDAVSVESVIGTALNFLRPRTLEAYSARQFTLWGLNGLTAIDPSLTAEGGADMVRLVTPDGVLYAQRAPLEGDIAGWAQAAVAMAQAAWIGSAQIRNAGQQAVIQSFFDELFNHLDPYSRYVAPVPASSDRSARNGAAAEAGITVARGTHAGHSAVITAVNANGPAWAAGISPGMRLLAVDGRPTRNQDEAVISGWLQGAAGSSVILTVAPAGRGPAQEIPLVRVPVPPETVFAFSSGDIVVLRVTGFSADTAQEMSQFLDQAMQPDGPDGHAPSRVHGLIFDLRGNRGGLLQQAVTSVALVLDHGVAVITRGRDPQADHIWSVQGGDLTGGIPIVVLVDGRTASAAEIMAAALADHRRAVVVGSATLGKGLVQTIAQLPDGGELFVTWSRVIAPLGWPLQGLGVMPQVCTSLGQAALDRALADLAKGIADNARAVRDSRRARPPLPVARILEIRAACPAAIGSDADLDTARLLIDNPARYHAALVPADAELVAPLP
jgi:carboxyl-terminal processing protease